MTTLIDAKFDALRALGHTGTISDMMVTWLQADGAVSESVVDAWDEMLSFQGFKDFGHRNDMWYALLGDRGFTAGTLAEREFDFWTAGGLIVP